MDFKCENCNNKWFNLDSSFMRLDNNDIRRVLEAQNYFVCTKCHTIYLSTNGTIAMTDRVHTPKED
jgi:hypothetical protein